MGDLITGVFALLGLYIAVRITIIPMQILDELKRQGALREEADRRLIALLSIISRGEKPLPECDDAAARLQAIADARLIDHSRADKSG